MGTPARGEIPLSPTCQRLPHFGFCSRKKVRAIRGKLRIKSPPGIFLILGAFVVVAGMVVAVAGYWPHRAHRAALLNQGGVGAGLSGTPTSRWGQGARGMLTVTSLVHYHRMRLLGPVIMGVGLFILICANTVLYENRDRETRLLLAQAQGPTCPVSIAVPPRGQPCRYHWFTKLTVSDLSTHHVDQQAKTQVGASSSYLHPCAQPEAGHPQGPTSPCASDQPSKPCFSMLAIEFHKEPLVSPSTACLKLSESLAEAPPTEEGVTVEAPTSCSFSVPEDVAPGGGHAGQQLDGISLEVEDTQDVVETQPDPLGACSSEPGSDMYLNVADSNCTPPDTTEERKHRSWPPLRLGAARRFWGLENKQDSLDQLLD